MLSSFSIKKRIPHQRIDIEILYVGSTKMGFGLWSVALMCVSLKTMFCLVR